MSTQIAIKQSQLQNWAIVIKECKESGLKVADFCSQHGISKHAYYYWFKKVRTELFSSQNSFVEISDKKETKSSDRSSISTNENIVVHVNGISISIPMSVTKEKLEMILGAACHVK